jgi:hypothetical protein
MAIHDSRHKDPLDLMRGGMSGIALIAIWPYVCTGIQRPAVGRDIPVITIKYVRYSGTGIRRSDTCS